MMELLIIKKGKLISLLIFSMFLGSCYYDNGDDLKTAEDNCDTTNVTYTSNIEPIINMSCIGCHSGSAPSGNISLDNYAKVKQQADNGNLTGTITRAPGYSPMPKNSPKLDDCSISQVKAWINQGTPN